MKKVILAVCILATFLIAACNTGPVPPSYNTFEDYCDNHLGLSSPQDLAQCVVDIADECENSRGDVLFDGQINVQISTQQITATTETECDCSASGLMWDWNAETCA